MISRPGSSVRPGAEEPFNQEPEGHTSSYEPAGRAGSSTSVKQGSIAMATPKLHIYGINDIDTLLQRLPNDVRFGAKVAALVLPFRVSNYVTDELIDWDRVPDDPIYQLTFAHAGMLRPNDFHRLAGIVRSGVSREVLDQEVDAIRRSLNPHSDGQTVNVPVLDGDRVPGVQHKYAETCLVFPASGQTCHAYCTYCFRWPQFVGMPGLRFATDEAQRFKTYIRSHQELTDVIVTGGDPMIMNARKLSCYVEPLLDGGFEHIQNIRIGTKALAYWPYRFLSDPDADDVLRLFEKVVKAGKHLALMAHFSHWRELTTPAVCRAIARIRATGAQIRTQAPVVGHVNDSSDVWARMWTEQVRLGCIPYYMFIARETGAHHYFAVPLARAFQIFSDAYRHLSGLCRTVRGPTMSTFAGKVVVDGIMDGFAGEQAFALRFIQARDPSWTLRPFLARFDPGATWFSQLRPLDGQQEFFFERSFVGHGRSIGVRAPITVQARPGGLDVLS